MMLRRSALRCGTFAGRDQVGVLDDEVGDRTAAFADGLRRAGPAFVHGHRLNLVMIAAALTPAIRTVLRREVSPEVIVIAPLWTPSAPARTSISSALAAPSTGAALSRTSSAPSRMPDTADEDARAITLTAISAPSRPSVTTWVELWADSSAMIRVT